MKLVALIVLVWCGIPHLLHGAELPSVRLFAGDKQITLRAIAQSQVEQQIIALIQSSNFHSGPGDKFHIFTASGVQQDYRDVVAGGEYLLMLFSPAKKIGTVGGEITAA